MADKKHEFHYGGQAVIEGVMMRGPKSFAVAVRRAGGDIMVTAENVETMFAKLAWLKKPFLRGAFALIDALTLGIKALKYSTDVAMQDIAAEQAGRSESAQGAQRANAEQPDASLPKAVNDIAINAMLVVGLIIWLAFFILVPIIFTRMLNTQVHARWQLTTAEGLLKIGLFVGYVCAISMLKDIRRVFQYHGAEHKTINAYEAGVDLNVDSVMNYTKVHVRCGTSFVLVVLVANIVVYALIGDHLPRGSLLERGFVHNLIRWAYQVALLPLVAGVAYEIIRFAGNCKDSILTKLILLPGLMMQKITTREPEPAMVEVAIRSLQSVLEKENADCGTRNAQ